MCILRYLTYFFAFVNTFLRYNLFRFVSQVQQAVEFYVASAFASCRNLYGGIATLARNYRNAFWPLSALKTRHFIDRT